MGFFHSFRARLFIAIVLVATVPTALLGGYSYLRVSEYLEKTALSDARDRLAVAADELRGFMGLVRADVLYLSRLSSLQGLIDVPPSADGALQRRLKEELREAFLSFSLSRTEYCQIRYIDETGQEVVRVDYDLRQHRLVPEELLQMKAQRYYFSETMQLERGEIFTSRIDLNREGGVVQEPLNPVARYCTPVFDGQGRRRGIVVINVAVGGRLQQTASLMGGSASRSFIAYEHGYYLYHSESGRAWGGARDLNTGYTFPKTFPWFHAHPTVSGPQEARHGRSVLVYTGVRVDPGTRGRDIILGKSYDVGEVLVPVAAFRKGFFALVVVTLCLAGALALELARKVSEPVRALQHGAERIGDGDLQHRIRLKSRDELGALAGSFNRMADELARHISDVQEATAARERVESDLRIAREIQESILPKRLPASSATDRIGFHGKSIPAHQVGGDLYEFFFKDEETLVLAVGDVSGKGVPAALLMAMAWVLLRTFAAQEVSPATVLKRMNRALLQPMGPSRFVSMFLAFYDTQSRFLSFANAGHCPPILVKPDGAAVRLMSTGMPLGVVDNLEAWDEEIQLSVGDRLVVYSDGVTEARNADGELFGFDRLQGLVANAGGLSLAALVEDVMSAVRAHEASEAARDDTTLWALEAR